MDFVHLHNHSYYSLLQSPAKPSDIIKKAKSQGCPAVALTDNGVMYGGIEFYKYCKKEDIKAIIGMEVFLTRRSMEQKEGRMDMPFASLVLLAENQDGYENLLNIASISNLYGNYYKPRIDWETLSQYKFGLIALSSGLSGEIAQAILNRVPTHEIEKIILRYHELFGENNFFLEIAHHPNLPHQNELNDQLIEWGEKLKIPVVLAQDAYYVNSEDREAQDVIANIGSNIGIGDFLKQSIIDDDYSIPDPSEIIESFSHCPEAIANTLKIAEIGRAHV